VGSQSVLALLCCQLAHRGAEEMHPLSLDRKLQDRWSPSVEDIEREAKL
jgi:hypothetical protein